MRDIFNNERYLERLQSCEFAAIILEQRHPPSLPMYTWSQSLSYRDRVTDDEIARRYCLACTETT
jgi:hypothetical protein